jgi:subtilisin family serine protease
MHKTLGTLTMSALVVIAFAPAAMAAPYAVNFHSGTVIPAAGSFEIPVAKANTTSVYVLLQLNDYVNTSQRNALKNVGVELLTYLPDRAYVASVGAGAHPAELAALGVRHVSAFRPEYKLHPRVTQQNFGAWSALPNSKRVLAVDIMPDVALDEAVRQVESIGGEAGHKFEGAHSILVAIEPEHAADLAALDAVLFVDEAPPPLDMVNDVTRQRLHVNEVQATPYLLNGDSVTIMVYDGGMIDNTHQDFGNRVTWNETGTALDHSTHVAGTVGGSGAASAGQYRGMAPNVRLISGKYNSCDPYCLYDSPNDFEPDYSNARRTFNIEATTNSIGANIEPNDYNCEWFGDYELTSRLLDRLVSNTVGSPLIMFFAAGNERTSTSPCNCCNAAYHSMSVPAGAKNIITVGATTSADAVASFSSWGPTDDGRIKPEVCARGVSVTSCVLGGGYGQMSGTSMATPATAGVGCLILQQWHRLFPGASDPLPETMKAILINSATDIGPTGPDFQTGFGLVNALQAVQNLLQGGVLESALERDEEYTRAFDVPTGLSALDVSLAWSDVPASGNVSPTLVNDLDLVLLDPSSGSHLPWILNPAVPGIPATTGVDSINVCERVHVANPVAGQWTLRVTGRLNGSDSQTFGLSANVPLAQSWAQVTGQLRSMVTQQGIPGRISVVGGSQHVTTDSVGNYFLVLPSGNYTLRSESFGFAALDTTMDATGGSLTANFTLRPALDGVFEGHINNQFNVGLRGAILHVDFPWATVPAETTDISGLFRMTLPGANTYAVTIEYRGEYLQALVSVPEDGVVLRNFVFVNERDMPTGPDQYGYYAYETNDPGYSAQYDWLEISPAAGGPGTAVTGASGNDWNTLVSLPFPVRFYGQTQTQIKVGADGWIGMGTSASSDSVYYRNAGIPAAAQPNGMICLFWDDLYPYAPEGGDIAQYYDQANGRFIIEYHDVPHFNPRTNRVTGQIILYDTTARPTRTGDNEFQLQFQTVDYFDHQSDADATIGAENYDGTSGLQIVFDGTYPQTCDSVGAQFALRFTTGRARGGCLQGHIVTVPPSPNVASALVQLNVSRTVNPDTSGMFFFDSVAVGIYSLQVYLAGYEQGQRSNLTIVIGDTLTADFELYRLNPARNLVGSYEPSTHEVHLHWQPPLWLPENAPRNPRHLDALARYGIELEGSGERATTTDTFFTYNITASRDYRFWIDAIYDGGRSDSSNNYTVTVDLSTDPWLAGIPKEFYLAQNYPNPFNPETRLEYGLPHAAFVTIEIFDLLGRQVAMLQNARQEAGVHIVNFNGTALGTGVYICRLQADSFRAVRKMLLMK